MFPLAGEKRLCPLCKAPLKKGEKTCKDCESKILQEAAETMKTVMGPEGIEDIDIDLGDLEKTLSEISEGGEEPHLYLCPVCGVLLSEEATLCPRCGAEFLEEEEEKEEEAPKTHLCMECGAFVEEGAASCPKCGVEIVRHEPKPEEVETKARHDEEKVEEQKRVSGALSLCPRCGAFLKSDVESCEICGASFVEKKKIGIGDIDRMAPEIPEKESGMCPTCGAFLDPETERCEICDAELPERIREEAEELLQELLPEAEGAPKEVEEVKEEPPVQKEGTAEEKVEVEPEEIDKEIDEFFQELESLEIEKTMEEARLPPEPELVAEVELEEEARAEPEELPKITLKTPPEEL
ncbi:MAG: zinc ribbon domain-containing protein, partial [Thermoplasmata archaeon]